MSPFTGCLKWKLKMQTLDLHGTQHHVAQEMTKRFLNYIELPCQIITGNSNKMKEIVKGVVKEYNWFCYEKDSYNSGTLIIVEKDFTKSVDKSKQPGYNL